MNTPQDPGGLPACVAYHLLHPDGSLLAIEGRTRGMEHRSTGLRLSQSPGASRAFVQGRARARIQTFTLTMLVEADNFAHAESQFNSITAFARNSVYLARYAPGLIEGADYIASRALWGGGKSVARPAPRAIQASHTAWEHTLELWPRFVYGVTLHAAIGTEDETTITTEDGFALLQG